MFSGYFLVAQSILLFSFHENNFYYHINNDNVSINLYINGFSISQSNILNSFIGKLNTTLDNSFGTYKGTFNSYEGENTFQFVVIDNKNKIFLPPFNKTKTELYVGFDYESKSKIFDGYDEEGYEIVRSRRFPKLFLKTTDIIKCTRHLETIRVMIFGMLFEGALIVILLVFFCKLVNNDCYRCRQRKKEEKLLKKMNKINKEYDKLIEKQKEENDEVDEVEKQKEDEVDEVEKEKKVKVEVEKEIKNKKVDFDEIVTEL